MDNILLFPGNKLNDGLPKWVTHIIQLDLQIINCMKTETCLEDF